MHLEIKIKKTKCQTSTSVVVIEDHDKVRPYVSMITQLPLSMYGVNLNILYLYFFTKIKPYCAHNIHCFKYLIPT